MKARLESVMHCNDPVITVVLHRDIDIPFAPQVGMGIGVHRHSGIDSEEYNVDAVHWSSSKQMFHIGVSKAGDDKDQIKEFLDSLRFRTDEEGWVTNDICGLIEELIALNNRTG